MTMPVHIHTIGFTKKSAREFFARLKASGVRRLVDVRLHNSSQLAGFAKQNDLAYFLDALCGIEYLHLPILAPTDEILKAYQKKKIDWNEYESRFLDLMRDRKIEDVVQKNLLDNSCLLWRPPPPACRSPE